MDFTVIRKRDHAARMARFYRLALQGVLGLSQDDETDGTLVAGGIALVREWGRIGSPGTVRCEPYPDEIAARAALNKLAAGKRRRGYQ